jgi:hypothetical protein
MDAGQNTFRNTQPQATTNTVPGFNYGELASDIASRMPIGWGTSSKPKRMAADAAIYNAVGGALAPAYGAQVGAAAEVASNQAIASSRFAGDKLATGNSQLGLANDLNTGAINEKKYADDNALGIAELAEERRKNNMQDSREGQRIKQAGARSRSGGAVRLSPEQIAERKAIDAGITNWQKTQAGVMKQEGADIAKNDAVGGSYLSQRAQQNAQRRALQGQMNRYQKKYGESYTGAAPIEPPPMTTGPAVQKRAISNQLPPTQLSPSAKKVDERY